MDKVTLYFHGGFGMSKIEATRLKVEVREHAQYARGVYVEFLPKRARKLRGFVQAYGPSLVVLEGWGHPDPDDAFLPEEPGQAEDVTIRRGRYSMCDPRWESDFSKKLSAYLDEKGSEILLHDFRGHEPGSRGMTSPPCTCHSCACEYDANN